MGKVLAYIDKFSNWTGIVMSVSMLALVVVVVFEVIMRYVFNSPTAWAFETTNMLCGGGSMLGAGYCTMLGNHVRIDVLWAKFSKRGQAICDVITFFFFIFFAWVLFWYGLHNTIQSISVNEHSITPWAPVLWPFRITIPLSGLFLILQGTANFIRDLQLALGKTPWPKGVKV